MENRLRASKVVYLSAGLNAGPFKGWLSLVCWILHNVTKLFRQYDWLICSLFFCLCSDMLRNNTEKVNFLCVYFFKTNYIWIILQYVTFHIQVEIGLFVMSLTLESFNRTFLRLWFYAAFILIEFGWSVQIYASQAFQWIFCTWAINRPCKEVFSQIAQTFASPRVSGWEV